MRSPLDDRNELKASDQDEYKTNADGTVRYTEEQLRTLKERKQFIQQRVKEKKDFRKDIDAIANDEQMLRNVASLDIDMPAMGAQVVTQPVTSSLGRQHSSLIYKEDFEVKISQMNERLQPEYQDAQRKLALSKRVMGPFPTHGGTMDDLKRKEEQQRQQVLARTRRQAQAATTIDFRMKGEVNPLEQTEGRREQELKDDIADSIEPDEVNQRDEDFALHQLGQSGAHFKQKPSQMMSECKKRKIRKILEKKQKIEEKKIKEAKELWRTPASKDGAMAEEGGPLVDANKDDDEDSGIETYEEKKKRENIEEYHKIRHLPKALRREQILKKNREILGYDSDAEVKAEEWHNFLNKVNREEEYPAGVILRLMMKKLQELGEDDGEEFATS